ncbi:hypothetical protein ABT147_00260 [Streptomyces sp. NPDC001868]|uniref:hypothetical protein n=1 Tax=Streptomyces sp. NPDC001868 TaxID=3154401 RepID=UPI0033204F60
MRVLRLATEPAVKARTRVKNQLKAVLLGGGPDSAAALLTAVGDNLERPAGRRGVSRRSVRRQPRPKAEQQSRPLLKDPGTGDTGVLDLITGFWT